jgi:hypothetical protein
VYKSEFARAETRYINWELNLTFPEPRRRIDFNIEAVWLRADGSVVTRQTQKSYIEPDWKSSWVYLGWGNRTPGVAWQAGSYAIELYIDGKKVASEKFRVY